VLSIFLDRAWCFTCPMLSLAFDDPDDCFWVTRFRLTVAGGFEGSGRFFFLVVLASGTSVFLRSPSFCAFEIPAPICDLKFAGLYLCKLLEFLSTV